MIYYDERAKEHTVGSDSGAQIADGLYVIGKQGACAESDWPYDVAKFKKKPPKACYTTGLKHLAVRYEKVPQDADAMKAVLATGYPIIVGATLFPEFESVGPDGMVPMPKAGEAPIGGHAFLIDGFDDTVTHKLWEDPNSWGLDWGDHGYFHMPQEYLTNAQLAGDFWVIYLVETSAAA